MPQHEQCALEPRRVSSCCGMGCADQPDLSSVHAPVCERLSLRRRSSAMNCSICVLHIACTSDERRLREVRARQVDQR